jgi:FdrA protein
MPNADASPDKPKPRPLIGAPPVVINVGLPAFAEDLVKNGARVVHVDWAPPAGGHAELAAILAKLGV